MPKLWTHTIEAHKEAVHDAVLDAAAALIAAEGIGGVSMSAIAATTGIGRATLYKYFPDVATILGAWHQRQIARHLAELEAIAARPNTPEARLRAVLEAYVHNAFGQRGHAMPMLHAGAHIARARAHLGAFVTGLIAAAAASGAVRTDIAPAELAAYCLAALDGAATSPSRTAMTRLVELTLDSLHPARAKR